MNEQVYRYAQEMMRYYKTSENSGELLEVRFNQLNEQLALTASRCLSADYCPVVTTQKRGIAGKIVIILKRLARKSTIFIVRDLTQEISAFQKELVHTLSSMAELQEEIMIELISMKGSAAGTIPAGDILLLEKPEGEAK